MFLFSINPHQRTFRFEVNLATIWTDGKAEVGRVGEDQRGEEKKREDEN